MATRANDEHDFTSLGAIAQASLRPVSFRNVAVVPIASIGKVLPHRVILAKNLAALLDSTVTEMHGKGVLYREAVRAFEKRFLVTVLRENGFNQCHAANALGMHRNTLSRTITELGIDLKEERRKR